MYQSDLIAPVVDVSAMDVDATGGVSVMILATGSEFPALNLPPTHTRQTAKPKIKTCFVVRELGDAHIFSAGGFEGGAMV